MKKTYLIFPNPTDVYTNLSVVCFKEELNNELIDLELIDSGTHYTTLSWVIFEDGIMIQG
jgi:hypothetical protein